MAGKNGSYVQILNRATREVALSNGVTLTLRPIPTLYMERLYNTEVGKPEPPMIEVSYGGSKKTSLESNPNDPDYLAALEAWNKQHQVRVMKAIITMGVADEPPADFRQQQLEFFPDATDSDMKYLWVAFLIEDSDMIGELVSLITGQTLPTPEAIDEAMDNFRGDGERD